jgi:hypothetical protein
MATIRQRARAGSLAEATCRQTVEALLAPLSTAWQPMATIRQRARAGSLAEATCRQTVERCLGAAPRVPVPRV